MRKREKTERERRHREREREREGEGAIRVGRGKVGDSRNKRGKKRAGGVYERARETCSFIEVRRCCLERRELVGGVTTT